MKTTLCALAAFLLVPANAAAATVTVHVRHGQEGILRGLVTFRGSAGESNRLTISAPHGWVLFRDTANRVTARGDCRQVDRHAARCPMTEDGAQARLGDRSDRAHVDAALVAVRGGAGDDILTGARGGDRLFGDAGADTLRGGRGADELTGGPGRDRLSGAGGDDVLVDGESDRQAARDVFDGGSSRDTAGADRGDTISYARRRRALRIDLGRHRTSTEDRIAGMESLIGGAGDDRLSGDGDDNWLEGAGGADVLDGRAGRDIPMGGKGGDRVSGGDGDDVVWGDEGRDRLDGGAGADLVISAEENGSPEADELACGGGRDDARSDSRDTLTGACEAVVAFSNGLSVGSRPAIAPDAATFRLTCSGDPAGCHGRLSLSGAAGEDFGGVHFDVAPDAKDVPVRVPLTAAAVDALRTGAVVTVDLRPDAPPDLEAPGGYRTLMRAIALLA